MTTSIQQIEALWRERVNRLGPSHARMVEVRNAVNGDIIIPLPEQDRSAQPATANIILMGLEQQSMRIASTMPDLNYPPLRPGIKQSEERARDRRLINFAWWDKSEMALKMTKRARYVTGYGMSPVVVRPNFQDRCPTWQIRDPIQTYAPMLDAGELVPDDVIFAYIRPLSWLVRNYPGPASKLKRSNRRDAHYRILEYMDADEFVLVAIYDMPTNETQGWNNASTLDPQAEMTVELERVPNRAGRPCAIVPGRIGLDRTQGQYDGLVPLYQSMSKLMALELIGMERTVWPETWVVSSVPGQEANIVTMADPTQGIIGNVSGGTITFQAPQPSPFGTQMIDRMERNMRIQGAVPAEYGSEATSNIRTGRRGDAVLSAAIDFPIQAAQQLFEASMREENKAAIGIYRGYWGSSRHSMWVSATKGSVTVTPETFESDVNFVRYSHAGADLQQLVVEGGQRLGIGTLSKRSFMGIDPMVEDVQAETDLITAEALETALLQSMQTRASQDPTFVGPLAEIIQSVRENKQKSLADVYLEADNRYKQQQEAQAQPGAPGAPGGPGGAPPGAGQPGLADPQGAIGPPPKSLSNLTDLLSQLGSNQRAAQPFQPQEG